MGVKERRARQKRYLRQEILDAASELFVRDGYENVSMRRIADKLLHAPTVRVKELAGSPGGDSYEAVLRVLFDLDPDAVQAVARADAVAPGWPEQEPPK